LAATLHFSCTFTRQRFLRHRLALARLLTH
jgi:hypothetical protein